MNRVEVADPADPRLAAFMGLRDHALRQERERPGGDMAGSFMAEGDVVISRAIAAGIEIERVLVDGRRTEPIAALVDTGVEVIAGGPDVLARVTGRPALRDPIACCVRPRPRSAVQLLGEARTVIVTEGVNNPTNMGVIVRCGAGLGVEALLADPASCDPLYRRAVRVSMGEVFAMAHARLGALPRGLADLHHAGFVTIALTPDPDATPIGELAVAPAERVALVLGAEGPGLTGATMAACSHRAVIPMAAGVDSINVGSAAAVAAYAIRETRRRGAAQ